MLQSDAHARARLAVLALAALAALVAAPLAAPLAAQEHDHEHGAHTEPRSHGLHFTHPLFAESVSPDSKLRLDYGRLFVEAGDDASELELEGELTFHRSFSIEAGVHLDPEAGELGETHVVAKLANYAFESAGVLLGYGVELGLPTGSDHVHGGSEAAGHEHAEPDEDIYEIAPFLNAGWTAGRWELVGWTVFEIPVNQASQETVGTELRYNASALYHATGRAEALLEAFGSAGLSGPEADLAVVNLAPGLRVRPFAGRPLVIGAGVALPLGDDRNFDTRVLVSAFWHF